MIAKYETERPQHLYPYRQADDSLEEQERFRQVTGELLEKYAPFIRKVASARFAWADPDTKEDVVQYIIVHLIEKSLPYLNIEYPRADAYIRTCVKNAAAEVWRKHYKDDPMTTNVDDFNICGPGEQYDDIVDEIAKNVIDDPFKYMPKQPATALMYKLDYHLDNEQIAKVMCIPTAAVSNAISRARRAIKKIDVEAIVFDE